MATAKTQKSLPSPVYKVGEDQELRMSYGMFNDIMRIVGNSPDATTVLITDPMARDLVIRRLFTDNKTAINNIEEELVSPFEIEIAPSDLDGILAWVADHVSHFFVSTGQKMSVVLEQYKSQIPEQDQEPENQS